MIGKPDGPTREDLVTLEQELDNNAYLCGDKMSGYNGGRKFYNKRAVRCGEPIEAHFYDPNSGGRGGRLLASRVVCAVCYVKDDVLSKDEIRQKGVMIWAERLHSQCAEAVLKLA